MAEFVDVLRQWRRFCKRHNHCGECEFDGKGICGEAHLSDVPYSDIELRIMAWAAEHPEPVFPTWGEWLEKQGIVKLVNSERYDEDYQKVLILLDSVENPIPADMAQKLGIEPKEG